MKTRQCTHCQTIYEPRRYGSCPLCAHKREAARVLQMIRKTMIREIV